MNPRLLQGRATPPFLPLPQRRPFYSELDAAGHLADIGLILPPVRSNSGCESATNLTGHSNCSSQRMAHKAPAQPLVNNPPCTSVSPSGKVSSLDGAAVGTWVDLRTTIVDCRAMNLWPASPAGDDASLVSAAREGDR